MSEFKVKVIPEWQIHPKSYTSPNGFYIYDCRLVSENNEIKLNSRGKVSIKGKMQKLDIGIEYEVKLTLDSVDPKYGASYWAADVFQDIPTTPESQRHYLQALLTETQVYEIYKVYPNQDIIELFVSGDFDYEKVYGFGKIVYERVRDKIISNLEYKELFSELGKYGVNYDLIRKIMDEFGTAQLAIQRIKENPYELTRIGGIGFKKADAIALNMARQDIKDQLNDGKITRQEAEKLYEQVLRTDFRIITGVKHVLGEEQNDGHTYTKLGKLIDSAVELLQIEEELIEMAIKREQFSERPQLKVIEEEKVMLMYTYEAEEYVANFIKRKIEKLEPLNFNVEEFIEKMERKYIDDFPNGLTDQQKSFFYMIKNSGIGMLVGYAGTGKSAMQKFLKELLFHLGLTVKWLTPTAKAARVLTEYLVDQKGMTIHRSIGYGQQKDKRELIEIMEDFIVVDEFSMVDVLLCSALFSKLKNPNVRVLFVGDGFQIPSVGCGNLLHDMYTSGVVPSTTLDIVFRQGEGGLLDIATKIREGEEFVDSDFVGLKKYGTNFRLHSVSKEYMTDGYEHYYKEYLEKYKPEDIMVMSMNKKGELGTVQINKVIQRLVNPFSSKEIEFGEDNVLKVKDYIMNTKNTYDIENINGVLTDIVNGESGHVKDIITDWKPGDSEDENVKNRNGILIKFENDTILMPLVDKIQLLHSWCITMHKAQGSSSPVVLIVIDPSNTYFCNANLIYTALTRARFDGVMICEADSLNRALKKKVNLRRRTILKDLLLENAA